MYYGACGVRIEKQMMQSVNAMMSDKCSLFDEN